MKVDVAKTQKYYEESASEFVCDCEDCKNYCVHIKEAYPEVATYLSSFGIDIEKPFEIGPIEQDDFIDYYNCAYIVFGTCSNSYCYKIGDVKFRRANSYPSTNIEDEHFVLEFDPIRLKSLKKKIESSSLLLRLISFCRKKRL